MTDERRAIDHRLLSGTTHRSHQLLPPLLLVLLVAIAIFAVGSATHLTRLRTPIKLPDVVQQVPSVSPRYLDRAAIGMQSVEPPGLVRTLLLPSIGAPSAVAPGTRMQIVLERSLDRGESLALVPRELLAPLDELLYATPPMPAGAEIVAARVASAEGELGTPPLPGEPRTISSAEEAAVVRRFAVKEHTHRTSKLLATIADESGDDLRTRVEAIRTRFDELTQAHKNELISLPIEGACASISIAKVCAQEVEIASSLAIGLYALALVGADGHVQDFQMNAVYRPRSPDVPPELVVAGDLQWGDNPVVSGKVVS